MPRTVEITIEPLEPKAFEPFGQIIGLQAGAPAFAGGHVTGWRLDFGSDGPVDLMFSRFAYLPMEFSEVERHFNVTQSFVPLGGAAYVMVVAPRTAKEGAAALPRADAMRAFYVDGSRGILLWKGTWHALTRFPARPPHADFAFITGLDTQLELERQKVDGKAPVHTEVHDFAREGVAFRVVDPRGLLR